MTLPLTEAMAIAAIVFVTGALKKAFPWLETQQRSFTQLIMLVLSGVLVGVGVLSGNVPSSEMLGSTLGLALMASGGYDMVYKNGRDAVDGVARALSK